MSSCLYDKCFYPPSHLSRPTAQCRVAQADFKLSVYLRMTLASHLPAVTSHCWDDGHVSPYEMAGIEAGASRMLSELSANCATSP